MKKIIAISVMSLLLFSSCASTKTTTKSLEKATYSQPGMDVLEKNKKGKFRAWAVGVSNSEMTAKSKAVAIASAELAGMIEKVVKSAVENYSVTLGDNNGDGAKSKELMIKNFTITANQVLKGVVTIYDKWAPKDENGMHKNYVVLELNGQDVVNALYSDYVLKTKMNLDKGLLSKLFLEAIDK